MGYDVRIDRRRWDRWRVVASVNRDYDYSLYAMLDNPSYAVASQEAARLNKLFDVLEQQSLHITHTNT